VDKLRKLFLFLLSPILSSRGVVADINVTGITDVDNAIPDKWAAGILLDGVDRSPMKKFMGKENSRMPIITKNLFAPKGDKTNNVVFNTIAQLYSGGVSGESTLKGNETKLRTGVFCITPELYRNAVGITEKSTLQANFDEVKTAGELLKVWANREISHQILESMLTATSQVDYANSRTSEDALVTADKFGTTEIDLLWLGLYRQGALPIAVIEDNGEELPIFGCMISGVDSHNLKANTVWHNAQGEAFMGHGKKSPLLTRAFGKFGGMIVYLFSGMAGAEGMGTPLRPECQIYGTLASGAPVITVGSDAKENLTRFFDSTGTLQIEDEFITYTAKTNLTFTGCTRGVTINSVGSTAVQHVNKAITQRNVATAVAFGAEALFFGWGKEPQPIGDKEDYGADIGLGIKGYWGMGLKQDKRSGRYPNVRLLKTYSKNPGNV